jgi:serine protease Do
MKEKDNFKNKQEKIKKFLLKEVRLPKLKKTKTEKRKREKNNLSPLKSFLLVSLIVLVSLISGFFAGTFSFVYFYLLENQGMFTIETEPAGEDVGYQAQTSEEAMVIKAVEENAPSVVSIIITKDLPVFEEYYYNPFGDPFGDFLIPQYRQKGTEEQQVGGGTGFIISQSGMILTNRHVVSDEEAEYTILTNKGEKYPAKILARDPVQDLAFLEIDKEQLEEESINFSPQEFKPIALGDSSDLQMGQTVIAIGNALGEFKNTVSVGVISGLSRTITASGENIVETLEDVIQTDAAINRGNSGGPLLNLKGEVIGVNVAMAESAQNIGFSIPINKAKRDIDQIKTIGEIVYPFLGVRYVLITPEIQEEEDLPVSQGALIVAGEENELAIVPNSPADEAGLKESDIILEVEGEPISLEDSLINLIQKYNPGDKVSLKIISEGEEKTIQIILNNRPQE